MSIAGGRSYASMNLIGWTEATMRLDETLDAPGGYLEAGTRFSEVEQQVEMALRRVRGGEHEGEWLLKKYQIQLGPEAVHDVDKAIVSAVEKMRAHR